MVVIGGGHNGLVAASYLARAGLKTTVLERSERVGGACVTDEILPGFRVSAAAYLAGLLRPEIIQDLALRKHGLRFLPAEPQAYCPFPGGRSLFLWSDPKRTARSIADFSGHDAEAYPRYEAFWNEIYDLYEPLLLAPPAPLRDLVGTLDSPQAEESLRRLLFFSAEELLEEFFESPEVVTAFANQSIIGHFAPPSHPGTAFTLSHNLLGTINGTRGVWGFAAGGMGSITSALERAAGAQGVVIQLGASVDEITCHDGRVTGVRLADGALLAAPVVVSTADPKATFLRLVPPDSLPSEFRLAVSRIKIEGTAMKVNCALRELPRWSSDAGVQSLAGKGSTYLAPSLEFIERACREARGGRPSKEPWVESVTQSAVDPTVAPPGKHTLSVYVQYTPYHLSHGSWDDIREEYADQVVDTIAQYAPNLPKIIERRQVITPLDLERRFGLTDGHQSHGDMGPDQALSFRPVPGWASYRTPIHGLYICGAGTHPGGGVSGAPGYNGAHAVLEDRLVDTARRSARELVEPALSKGPKRL